MPISYEGEIFNIFVFLMLTLSGILLF